MEVSDQQGKNNFKLLILLACFLSFGAIIVLVNEHLKNNNKLELELNKLKLERLREADSLKMVISFREKENEMLKNTKEKIVKEVQFIKDKPVFIPSTNLEAYKYFVDRYPKDTISSSGNLINLYFNASKSIISDLEDKDKADAVIVYQDSIISIDSILLKNLEKDKIDLGTMLESCNLENKSIEDLYKLSQQNISKLQKKIKRKNALLGVAVPVSFGVGVFVGTRF